MQEKNTKLRGKLTEEKTILMIKSSNHLNSKYTYPIRVILLHLKLKRKLTCPKIPRTLIYTRFAVHFDLVSNHEGRVESDSKLSNNLLKH